MADPRKGAACLEPAGIPPSSPVNKSPALSGIEGKHVEITGRIEMHKGKREVRINAAEQLEVE